MTMEEIDWPAWVQAVGSVAALVLALGLALWQSRRERADRMHRSARFCQTYCVQTLMCVDKMQLANRGAQDQGYRSYRIQLERIRDMQINLADFSAEQVALMLSLAGIATDVLISAPERLIGNEPPQLDTLLGNAGHDCRQCMRQMGMFVPTREFP